MTVAGEQNHLPGLRNFSEHGYGLAKTPLIKMDKQIVQKQRQRNFAGSCLG
jgi:hypothetical protein